MVNKGKPDFWNIYDGLWSGFVKFNLDGVLKFSFEVFSKRRRVGFRTNNRKFKPMNVKKVWILWLHPAVHFFCESTPVDIARFVHTHGIERATEVMVLQILLQRELRLMNTVLILCRLQIIRRFFAVGNVWVI